MPTKLKVLIVEDNPVDAELTLHELSRAGYDLDWKRVEREKDYVAQLDRGWDIILADYSLPEFSGLRALELLRARDPDLPFILVSGTIAEGTAVVAMKAGASDYIMKDRVARLAPAVERELREAVERRKRKQAEQALNESEKRYRELFENSMTGISQARPGGDLLFANNAYAQMYGYENAADLMAKVSNVEQFYAHPKDREEILRILNEKGSLKTKEIDVVRRDGTKLTVLVGAREIRDAEGNLNCYQAEHIDVSDRKRAQEALRESENKYRLLADNVNDVIFVLDMNLNYTFISPSIKNLRGFEPNELLNQSSIEMLTPASRDLTMRTFSEIMELEKAGRGENSFSRTLELEIRRKDATTVWTEVKFSSIRDENRRLVGLTGVTRDITERKGEMGRVHKALEATIRAIAVTVEARDPYTAGHQRRVSHLARAIGVEMGLPADQIGGLQMAGAIHDIGKISLPAEILSKPTKLSAIEFMLIKTHAQAGFDILKDIEFPWSVARMVLEHHERMDGSGYPNNLRGDQILPLSGILAVADVVEAMASNRPYRPSLSIDEALAEISKNRGIFYRPDAADACLRLFRDKGYQIIA